MQAKIALYQDESGAWVAECLNMPGCVSQGVTRAEALSNIQDAARGWLAVMREDDPDFASHLPEVEITDLEVAV